MNIINSLIRKALKKNVLELRDGGTYVFFVPNDSYALELHKAFQSVFDGKTNPPKVLILQTSTVKMKVVNVD